MLVRTALFVALASVALLSTSCRATAKNLDPPPPAPSAAVARDTVISLERAECPSGTCPVYRVTMFGDGTTVIDTTKARRVVRHLQGSEVVALADEIEQKSFFDMQDQPPCSPDNGPATISVTHHGKTKVVKHTLGCPPDEAEQIVTRIDTVARSDKWAW
jgi:hypothetical protein